jgi:hypothetical protein
MILQKKYDYFVCKKLKMREPKLKQRKMADLLFLKTNIEFGPFFYLQSSNSFLLNLIFQDGVDRDLKFIIYFDLVFMW